MTRLSFLDSLCLAALRNLGAVPASALAGNVPGLSLAGLPSRLLRLAREGRVLVHPGQPARYELAPPKGQLRLPTGRQR